MTACAWPGYRKAEGFGPEDQKVVTVLQAKRLRRIPVIRGR
jgi:hypothetical protein